MFIYRTGAETLCVSEWLTGIRERHLRSLSPSDPIELLVDLGTLETGILDKVNPQSDTQNELTSSLRRASILAAHLLHNRFDHACRHHLLELLDRLAGCPLPDQVDVSIPEGYAFYGLFPQAYAEAGRRFYHADRPEAAVVIGIRNIGTSLSAAVAGTLERLGVRVSSVTVRPRGHPFERVVSFSTELIAWMESLRSAHFLIVDEGPGLSGSSFAAVADALSAMGIPDARIVLFPSWEPSGDEFVSAAAAGRWKRHRKYCVDSVSLLPESRLADWSAGRWRVRQYSREPDWPAVQPQHERRKFRDGGCLLRFAGLGRYGAAKLPRAETLYEAGYSMRPRGLDHGFLALEYVPGRPLSSAADVTEDFLRTASGYLRFLRLAFPSPKPVPFDELVAMAQINAELPGELLEPFRSCVSDTATVALDGRMLPHEWIQSGGRFWKTDALDHHDDHFLPGCQDIAWDVAGASVEFQMTTARQDYLASLVDPHLAARLPFYVATYLAFRIGYAATAQQAIAGSADAARFAALEQRYRQQLSAWRAARERAGEPLIMVMGKGSR